MKPHWAMRYLLGQPLKPLDVIGLNAGPVPFGLIAGPVPVSIFCFLIRDMHAYDQDVDLIRIFIPRPTLVLFFLFFGPRH